MGVQGSSHLDDDGAARMVNVGAKSASERFAEAKSRVKMLETTRNWICDNHSNHKGDILQIARLAGIQAAKQTANLIPLCHVVPLDGVELSCVWTNDGQLEWTAKVFAQWKTGVEMEALLAASVAALTIYDMCKSIDRSMEVTHVGLWKKSGGKSGNYARQ